MIKRFLGLLAMIAVLAAGCGRPPATSPPSPLPPESAESPAPEAAEAGPGQDLVRMRGTEFYLYDARPMAGAARKPLMHIRAGETSVGLDGGASVSFTDARAIIRSTEDPGQEIIFQAAEGSFVENERAYLRGGVVAQVGEMTVQLEDIEMTSPTTDTPILAESANAVIIDGPGMHLQAESLRLFPDDKTFELSDGSGYIDFGRLQP
jgi:hypothetical protein